MITIGNFEIEICKYSGKYNVYHTRTFTTGKTQRVDMAFAISLEDAVERIKLEKLRKSESVTDLDTFLKEYKELSLALNSELKSIINKLKKRVL